MSLQSTQQEEQQSIDMSALLVCLWNIAVGNRFLFLFLFFFTFSGDEREKTHGNSIRDVSV